MTRIIVKKGPVVDEFLSPLVTLPPTRFSAIHGQPGSVLQGGWKGRLGICGGLLLVTFISYNTSLSSPTPPPLPPPRPEFQVLAPETVPYVLEPRPVTVIRFTPPEPEPEIKPEPNQPRRPTPKIRNICERHGLVRVDYGRSWRCRRKS